MLAVTAFAQAPTEPAARPQQQAASPCPRVDVQGQSARAVREGQPVTFVANIQGGDTKVTPQILWSVSGGMIRDGQETRKIEVDSTGAGYYREIVANLWVGGYAPECMTQASATVHVVPPASKADEFGELAVEKENERLAAAVTAIAPSGDRLLVIVYAGRTSERGYASNALRRIRTQLLNSGMQETQLAVMDGGFREQPAYELWAVPVGAEFPKATPTIDRREIIYPKPAVPARKPRKTQ
jgi:hypothetical protein